MLKAHLEEPKALVNEGNAALKAGNYREAFAYYDFALDRLHEGDNLTDAQDSVAQTRINLSIALSRIGKLALAEQEVRHALRSSTKLSPTLVARAMLVSPNIHADQGDLLLSEIEAEKVAGLGKGLRTEPRGRARAPRAHSAACWPRTSNI